VNDFHAAPISDAEHAMLAYVERLTREPWTVREDDIRALRRAGWNDRAIHDMAQVTAYFNYVNRLADGLGVSPESEWPDNWPED
jgi:uncharacterized peroxidase-related enzyme